MITDAAVLTCVLAALAAGAQRHSPPDRSGWLTAEARPPGVVEIRLTGGAGDIAPGTHRARTVHGLP
ncbi:hypothetical protein [Streptomyces sp. NPDC059957]|uniref:hypothetical protein n=1 Tax=Streptomyces sp. NPDC059957 TaxID=3347016 RepID=UPI0036627CE7